MLSPFYYYVMNRLDYYDILPEGMEVVSYGTFDGCSSLEAVTVPNSVVKIGSAAFGGCGQISRVVIGKKVTTIADSAFAGCSLLSTVYLPKSLTYIGNSAFSGCLLLSGVHYAGTARDFAKITVESGNTTLTAATLKTGQKY